MAQEFLFCNQVSCKDKISKLGSELCRSFNFGRILLQFHWPKVNELFSVDIS